MNGEPGPDIFPGFSDEALGYLGFLGGELAATEGAFYFQIHHPAPAGVTPYELEIAADDLREHGWNAVVAPVGEEDDTLLGILIQSDSIE